MDGEILTDFLQDGLDVAVIGLDDGGIQLPGVLAQVEVNL